MGIRAWEILPTDRIASIWPVRHGVGEWPLFSALPSPIVSAANVRLPANAVQARRLRVDLGVQAVGRESQFGPSEGGRGCEGPGRTHVVRVLPNGCLRTQPKGCGTVRPVVRIIITPAAYAVVKATLAKGANEPPPQRDAAGRFVIYVEETYVDQLKAQRQSCENYSDVILRLAEPEATKATVVKLAERG
jgi:hypothetical protein